MPLDQFDSNFRHTYRLQQIATFLLLFPKTPLMAIFKVVMAIMLCGYLRHNGHMTIIWSKMGNIGVFGNVNKNVAI